MRESSNPSSSSSTSVSDLIQSIFSYNGNVMLAALVSFLLVLLFVLLLHVYAKWFFAAQARDNGHRSITVSRLLTNPRVSNFQLLTFDSYPTNSPTKGLNPSAIALIPLFVYESDKKKNGLESVICLNDFEDLEIGRSLPKCSHAFHVESIDMWLSSHSNCPICRAPAADEATSKMDAIVGLAPENEIIRSTASFGCYLKRMLRRNK